MNEIDRADCEIGSSRDNSVDNILMLNDNFQIDVFKEMATSSLPIWVVASI